MITSPVFWFVMMLVGVGCLVVAKKMNLLNNTYVAIGISVLIALGYFHLVDHYLMDMQGLDYWYLFRQ